MKPARAARLLFQLPKTSRVFLVIEPANQWDWQEVLLNKVEYALQVIAWQNANEGVPTHKQTEKPSIFRPPFMPKVKADPESVSIDIDDYKKLMSKPRA